MVVLDILDLKKSDGFMDLHIVDEHVEILTFLITIWALQTSRSKLVTFLRRTNVSFRLTHIATCWFLCCGVSHKALEALLSRRRANGRVGYLDH